MDVLAYLRRAPVEAGAHQYTCRVTKAANAKGAGVHRIVALFAALALVVSLAGCAPATEPVTESREVLGTAVSVAVYSADASGAAPAIDAAFASMSAVESELSPYDATSTISAFNRAPYQHHPLPADAVVILNRTQELGVSAQFSPALFGVTNLYDFGGAGTVPTAAILYRAVQEAGTFRVEDGSAWFTPLPTVYGADGRPSAAMTPGLDFGGASKGLALDRAAAALRDFPALITAGSSTLAFGRKPDGQPWRVGIEDPREVGRVLAVVSSVSTLSVSTSGDYQVYFERDGVRYHHILSPVTGQPVRGTRSLTVFGQMSGLDADILSTAMFVMGRIPAFEYAHAHGIGVYLVDEAGGAYSYVPRAFPVILSEEAKPRP
jgi:thiamine biosynthesis lipoprotein